MELNELLKMISSIPERKTKCRGNLRLKVLLKTTYDYARSSWIDGQFGKPQKLETLLKNSVFNRSSSSDDSSSGSDSEADISSEEQSTLKFNHQDDTSESDDILRRDLSLEEEEEEEDSEDNGNKPKGTKDNLPELQRVMKKLLKNCNMLIEVNDRSRSSVPDYHLNLRKLKRIIHLSRLARVQLERDYENQDLGQQKINRRALKLIRYLLKQCKTLLKVNYCSQVDHHKLRKIIKKLRKFESCAEKVLAFEKFCDKAMADLNSWRHVDKMDALNQKECQFSFKTDQNDSNGIFKQISSQKINPIQTPDVIGANSQNSKIETDRNDQDDSNSNFKQISSNKINLIQTSDVISTNSLKSETEKISRKRTCDSFDYTSDIIAKYKRTTKYIEYNRNYYEFLRRIKSKS